MILGICCFVFGSIVNSKVKSGQEEIRSAQKGVNAVKGATSINPYSKVVGEVATKSIQKKINQGKVKASKFQKLAFWFKLGGVALFVIGAILLII